MPESSETPEQARKRIQSGAQFVRDSLMGADHDIIPYILQILLGGRGLAAHIRRLENAIDNNDHFLYSTITSQQPKEFQAHMVAMRREQLGAVLHLAKVMVRTRKKSVDAMPGIDAAARKRILDESLGRIGLDDIGHNVP